MWFRYVQKNIFHLQWKSYWRIVCKPCQGHWKQCDSGVHNFLWKLHLHLLFCTLFCAISLYWCTRSETNGSSKFNCLHWQSNFRSQWIMFDVCTRWCILCFKQKIFGLGLGGLGGHRSVQKHYSAIPDYDFGDLYTEGPLVVVLTPKSV